MAFDLAEVWRSLEDKESEEEGEEECITTKMDVARMGEWNGRKVGKVEFIKYEGVGPTTKSL